MDTAIQTFATDLDSALKTWGARWIVPVDRPPLQDASLTTQGGRIICLTENGRTNSDHDLGDVALTPTLVNAHTHLEFSSLAQPLGQPGMAITDWIPEVIRWRMNQAAGEVPLAVAAGINETSASGVGIVGEIATSPWYNEVKVPHNLAVNFFVERLGNAPSEVGEKIREGKKWLAGASEMGPPFHGGISPHAPYSLCEQLFAQLIDWAKNEHRPVAMHLAESPQELEFVRSGAGPFAEMLERLSVRRTTTTESGRTIQGYLHALAATENALVIHGNYLTVDEIRFLGQQPNIHLVYCPRTHHFFRHANYPLSRAIDCGVNVAIGTDSRASNPDLNILAELKLVHEKFPELDPAVVFSMGTLNGAKALQADHQLGSLTKGKLARFLAIPLANPNDLWQSILSTPQNLFQDNEVTASQP